MQGTAVNNPNTLFIGGSPGDNNIGTFWLHGYIDDVRVTDGVARTVTVPTAPYPDA